MLPTLQTITDQLATAIGQHETNGGSAGVGASLNNIGAMKFAPWETAYGATPTPSGFAAFPSLQDSFNAAKARVAQLIAGGASITDLVNTWAPPSDGNKTNPARIADMSGKTGLDPKAPIKDQSSGADSESGSGSGIVGGLIDSALGAALGATGIDQVVAFVVGLVLVIIGLLSLKTAQQVIVQPAMQGLKQGLKKGLTV
jgi:hypothetical protein